jgi:transcriptional regulator with XRE-family HTH domain
MGDLALTLKQARHDAGLSLAGMARRLGYSRSYVSNIENGRRAVTPEILRRYELVLGEDLKRRTLIVGSIAALATTTSPDVAISIAHDIEHGRYGSLATSQTSHATDRAIASLVARDSPSVVSLIKWAGSGKSVLRVNATGILAKVGSPLVDNEAVGVLRTDGDVRALYLTAVISRVLSVPWDRAYNLAVGSDGLPGPGAVTAFSGELTNPHDAGARWCSVVMLARSRADDPASVTEAFVNALQTEPSRENLRTIGLVLGGRGPLDP